MNKLKTLGLAGLLLISSCKEKDKITPPKNPEPIKKYENFNQEFSEKKLSYIEEVLSYTPKKSKHVPLEGLTLISEDISCENSYGDYKVNQVYEGNNKKIIITNHYSETGNFLRSTESYFDFQNKEEVIMQRNADGNEEILFNILIKKTDGGLISLTNYNPKNDDFEFHYFEYSNGDTLTYGTPLSEKIK